MANNKLINIFQQGVKKLPFAKAFEPNERDVAWLSYNSKIFDSDQKLLLFHNVTYNAQVRRRVQDISAGFVTEDDMILHDDISFTAITDEYIIIKCESGMIYFPWELTGTFPAYVFHYTDFSVGRKEPLKRDIRVSNSREQIFKIMDQFIADNVKKGWAEKV